MPQIPVFDNNIDVTPGPAPHADPGAFAAPGEALAQFGQAASGELLDFEKHYADAKRQADASDITAEVSQKLGDAQFRWSKTPDRQAARAGFDAEAAQIKKDALARSNSTELTAYLTNQIDQETTIRSLDTANAAFQMESSQRRANLDRDLAGYAQAIAGSHDPFLTAHLTDQASAAIAGAKAATWISPEDAEKLDLNFRSTVQETRVRQMLNASIASQNPDDAESVAKALSDPQTFPGLNPERREILASHVDTLQFRLEQRSIARQAHADAMGERALKRTQAMNEASLLASIHSGQQIGDADIQKLADTQAISAGGVQALETARDRAMEGRDDPHIAVSLWAKIGDGTASKDDVFAALGNGVKTSTATAMMRAITAHDGEGAKSTEKAAYNELKTALSGTAIENGIDVFGQGKAQAMQRWAQAQGEFAERVYGEKQDPRAVVADLIPRYAPKLTTPVWLPAPKFGAVNSAQEMNAVAARTVQAFKAKQIGEADYRAQVQLLNQYKSFYDALTQRQAATAKPGKTGAAVVGVQPE